jgi:hypothetical protein
LITILIIGFLVIRDISFLLVLRRLFIGLSYSFGFVVVILLLVILSNPFGFVIVILWLLIHVFVGVRWLITCSDVALRVVITARVVV